jgi:hypothetical protein
MSKIDFIEQFNDICDINDFNFNPIIEHGIKVSKNNVNTDRVNINIANNNINEDIVLNNFITLFDDNQDIISFIKDTYKNHPVQNIFFGYSNGETELYFEMYEPGESSYCYAYNSSNGKISKYYPLVDPDEPINELCELITKYTGLIIPEPNEIFKGGFIRDRSIYYFLVLEPMIKLGDILKQICCIINPDETEVINNWFEENKDSTLTHIAYSIENENLTLNIYTNEPRTT